jgi:hypothetical protein
MLRRRVIADEAALNNGRSSRSSQNDRVRTVRRRLRRIRHRIRKVLWREEVVFGALGVGLAIALGFMIGHAGS